MQSIKSIKSNVPGHKGSFIREGRMLIYADREGREGRMLIYADREGRAVEC